MSIATLVPFETGTSLVKMEGLRSGFFGREGGVSDGNYASLNASESGGDAPDRVARNRAIAAHELGFAPEALNTLSQVHGRSIITLTEPLPAGTHPEADGMVTAQKGLLLGILTADCAPVLLADAEAGVIGAAHAGWRGALSGVIEETISAMVALGAMRHRIRAAIGPDISAEHYEVGETFRDEFLRHDSEADRFFSTPHGGKPHFDLTSFVVSRLALCDIENVQKVGGCTYAEPARYFSHRYATHQGTTTGRQIAMIGWLDASE